MSPENSQTGASPSPHSAGVDTHHASASRAEHVADPAGRAAALQTLGQGARGAAIVASIALLLVLLLWLLFYLLVFLPRGHVE